MKPLPLLLAGLAVFALGAWVGAWVSAPFFHQALDEEAKKSKAPPRSDTTGAISLGDALQIAEEKFGTVDHLHDRTIGALWKANENGAEYIYADIWPPYQGESPPANSTLRLAIRVDHQGVVKWTWIQGTELVTHKMPGGGGVFIQGSDSIRTTYGAEGRRRIILPPPVQMNGVKEKGRIILPPQARSK